MSSTAQAAINLGQIKLRETLELIDSRLFVGEVVSAYADGKCLTDRKLDIVKTEQFSLIESPTAGYFELGEQFEEAFQAIRKHFQDVFQILFGGVQCDLRIHNRPKT